ncbi:hypothetical protein ACFQ4N_13640 [Oceanobacillus iheyensis]
MSYDVASSIFSKTLKENVDEKRSQQTKFVQIPPNSARNYTYF